MLGHGDLHRKFSEFMALLKEMEITDENILNVGDFGIGFAFDDVDYMRTRLNPLLVEKNIHVWVIRGNHDDPRFFKGKYMNMFSHIHFVPDYTVLEIEGKQVLFIGGAISVDRLRLKKLMLTEEEAGKLPRHFDDERLSFTVELELYLKSLRGIDIVVTHTAPSYCFPFGTGVLPKEDKLLAEELKIERLTMDRIFEILLKNNKIKYHIYGHYHHHNQQETENIIHYCLAENELKELYFL